MVWVYVFFVLAICTMLVKRALLGQQKQFARSSCVAIGAGAVTLGLLSSEPGDLFSWMGALLIMTGLLIAIAMILTDLVWTVRTGLADQKNK